MSKSIGAPDPDCVQRADEAAERAAYRAALAHRRGVSDTEPNGEEVSYDLTYALNYHKGLPHDVNGTVHRASYEAMVRPLTAQEYGSAETLPVGRNRTPAGGSETNPPRFALAPGETAPAHLPYRKLTSPFTGHVFDTQGADPGSLCQPPAPLVASDELAAEMAKLYLMALLRDASFADIAALTTADARVAGLAGMPWFDGTAQTQNGADARRLATRGVVTGGAELFRGSTIGSKTEPLLSQFMLMGSDNTAFAFEPIDGNNPAPAFPGRRAEFGREDGFVLFGTQVIDQRGVAARPGVDYLTNWAAWLDCQNGADFSGKDVLRTNRRFITTPRHLATYVHFDALYQAYLVACLLMLGDGNAFPLVRGLPEAASRTRLAFGSFGGPHVLSLVTEVATRALTAVWRQKWMHHRRTRPEVVAALITLQASQPNRVPNQDLRDALGVLRGKIPAAILDAVRAANLATKATTPIQPKPALPVDFPAIPDATNYLLPMAFPEASPTHPAYGASHATVAGACVTVLKAFFAMYNDSGAPKDWPYAAVFRAAANGQELTTVPGPTGITVEGELDKLAANVSIGRNMAGVHYYTDYYESVRLGERVAVSILEEQMSIYGEPVSMSFTSFDSEHVRITANGDRATVRIFNGSGPVPTAAWFERHAA